MVDKEISNRRISRATVLQYSFDAAAALERTTKPLPTPRPQKLLDFRRAIASHGCQEGLKGGISYFQRSASDCLHQTKGAKSGYCAVLAVSNKIRRCMSNPKATHMSFLPYRTAVEPPNPVRLDSREDGSFQDGHLTRNLFRREDLDVTERPPLEDARWGLFVSNDDVCKSDRRFESSRPSPCNAFHQERSTSRSVALGTKPFRYTEHPGPCHHLVPFPLPATRSNSKQAKPSRSVESSGSGSSPTLNQPPFSPDTQLITVTESPVFGRTSKNTRAKIWGTRAREPFSGLPAQDSQEPSFC